MKLAPLHELLRSRPDCEVALVHTGQHYDAQLSDVFIEELGLPEPDFQLGVGSGSHGEQTAAVLARFESLCSDHQPDVVLVVGDVNSTIACALAAAKLRYADGARPVIGHVEAGLRSFDRSMPEEINRLLTDAISDLLFATERSANENLRREGIPAERIFFVGNVMIDTLKAQYAEALKARAWERYGLSERAYGVLTLHRPSNVDRRETLAGLISTLGEVAGRIPIVFPMHPRTRGRIEEFGLEDTLGQQPDLIVTPPLGYREFLGLMGRARIVLSDSGGIQEEATILGVDCLTLRPNTERPVTVTEGTNRIVGADRERILESVDEVLSSNARVPATPELWDGKAAGRICDILEERIFRASASARDTAPR